MFLLFDIGGTNMRVAVSNDGQNITASKIIAKPEDFSDGIAALKEVAEELSKNTKFDGIAGGIAGVLDKEKTQLIQSSHIMEWVGNPLKQELEKVFGCKALLENDADIEGLGEATRGAGKGNRIVAHITLGTGVGGVRIIDGKIDQNSLGFEPGHQIIVPDGDPCNCGGEGHLEVYVAGSYVEQTYGQKGEHITDPKVWERISRYLAIGLVNTAVHWSPDVITLGGNAVLSVPLEQVQAYFNELLTIFPTAPQILKSTLNDDAGLYGALELLKGV